MNPLRGSSKAYIVEFQQPPTLLLCPHNPVPARSERLINASCRAACVKIVSKTRGKQSREKVLRKLAGEADYLMRVQECPGIVQLFETYEDADKVYFVCELCSGGDLEHVIEVCTACALVLGAIVFALTASLAKENCLCCNRAGDSHTSLLPILLGSAARFRPARALLLKATGHPVHVCLPACCQVQGLPA